MMMKTILEHFESVEDQELSEKLIKNYNPNHDAHENPLFETLNEAIDWGFDWLETHEGVEYWLKIFDRAHNSEIKLKSDD